MPDIEDLKPVSDNPISVILLTRNAEAHVQSVVRAWVTQLNKRTQGFEIIVVDDGSTDGTRELADVLAEGREEVRVIRHLTPRGIGAAITTGLEVASHPLIVTSLCQPDYSPKLLPRFLKAIDEVHFVSGFRAGRKMPTFLRVMGWLWRWFLRIGLSIKTTPRPGFLGWRNHLLCGVARWIFGVRIRDVGCPYRMFRREIFPRMPLQSRGEFALIEQLAKANYLTCFFSEDEIPVEADPSLGEWQSSGRQLRTEIANVFSHPQFGRVLPAVIGPEAEQTEPENGDTQSSTDESERIASDQEETAEH